MISDPFVRRTRAIFRIAELGFLGVFVVTFVQTPLLNGELKYTGRFLIVLKPRVRAIALDLRIVFVLFLLTNCLNVGICVCKNKMLRKALESNVLQY